MAKIVNEFNFDLAMAESKLNNVQCKMLYDTISNGNKVGKGNLALDIVIAYCEGLGIARRHGEGASINEFVAYLKERKDA